MTYTTEKLLELFSDAGYRAFKKLNKNTVEYLKLQRKEPTEINGRVYRSWKEYCNYQMLDYLNEGHIHCFINEDNQIELYLNDSEQQKLNSKLYSFLKTNKLL